MAEPRCKYYVWLWGDRPALKPGSNIRKVFKVLQKADEEGATLPQIAIKSKLSKPQARKALASLLAHPRSCLAVFNLENEEANLEFAVERIRLHLHFGDLHACDRALEWIERRAQEAEKSDGIRRRTVEALVLSLRQRPFRALNIHYSEEENGQIAQIASEWINDLVNEYKLDFEARINEERGFELELFVGSGVIDLNAYRRFKNQLALEGVAAQ